MEGKPKSVELFRKHRGERERQLDSEPAAVNFSITTDEDLYTYLKECESEYKTLLKTSPRPIVLDRATAYTALKSRTFAAFQELLLRDTTEEIMQTKKISERFWGLIKKELKRAEREMGENRGLQGSFSQLLEGNKDLLTAVLRKFWKTHNVQTHLNVPDDVHRKSAAVLHFGIAEITKLK